LGSTHHADASYATTRTANDLDDDAVSTVGSAPLTSASSTYGTTGTAATDTAYAANTAYDRNADTSGEVRVPVTDETAEVHKVTRETGQVGVSKDVDIETRHISEPVTRTKVIVEEHDLGTGAHAATGNTLNTGETISVPVTEEELVVQKVPHTKEVVIRTQAETETVERDVDLRHERVDVDTEGDVDVEHVGATGHRTVG